MDPEIPEELMNKLLKEYMKHDMLYGVTPGNLADLAKILEAVHKVGPAPKWVPKKYDMNPTHEEQATVQAWTLAHKKKEEAMTPTNEVKTATKQAASTTEIVHADGSKSTAIEAVGKPKIFAGPTCEVGFSSGATIGLEKYSSARVDVTLKIPCAHTELDSVYDFAKAWVDHRLKQVVEGIYASGKVQT